MALALFNSNPQELGFAGPSRKLGLEARFCISPFANGLNRGTGRFTPSFSGVPQSAPLHFGLSPWHACESGLQWVMANTAVFGLTVGSRRGGVHPQCYRFVAHLAAPQRAPKRSRLRNDRAAIAAGVARSYRLTRDAVPDARSDRACCDCTWS
jgi:hypothetical protein